MKRLIACGIVLITTVAIAEAQTFQRAKIIDAKGQESPVVLTFDRDLQQLAVTTHGELLSVPYSRIQKLSYEQAARRRVKEGAIVMIASLGVGGIVMLTKSKRHWFYVDYVDEEGQSRDITFRLDKSEYEAVLRTAADQTAKPVNILPSQKGRPAKQ